MSLTESLSSVCYWRLYCNTVELLNNEHFRGWEQTFTELFSLQRLIFGIPVCSHTALGRFLSIVSNINVQRIPLPRI